MLFQFITRDELRQQSIIAIHEIGVVVVLLATKNHRHHPAQAEFATVNEQPGRRRFPIIAQHGTQPHLAGVLNAEQGGVAHIFPRGKRAKFSRGGAKRPEGIKRQVRPF